MRYIPTCLLLLLAVAWPSAYAEAARRPDRDVRYIFDLARGDEAPLSLVMDLHEGMWQFGDHRTRGRLESDATYATSWLFSRDSGATGWNAQAYLAIYEISNAVTAATGPTAKRKRGKTAPAAFLAYLKTLPKRYAEDGFRIAIPAHTPHATRELRMGRLRVPLWFTDLGIANESKSRSARQYRATVFGFVVRNRLVTLRVRQLDKDLASLFIDGMSLTMRSPKRLRDAKFTSVTNNRTETRMTFRMPKGYARDESGKPGSAPRGRMGEWTRIRKGRTTGRITLNVIKTAFEPERDVAGWKSGNTWAATSIDTRRARAKRIAHTYASGPTTLDQQVATGHVAIWYVGTHRYVLRMDVLQPSSKTKPQGRKEMEAMIRTIRSWETRALKR